MNPKILTIFHQFDQHEYNLCLKVNYWVQSPWTLAFFAVISRLGNGVFWYGLMSILLIAEGMNSLPLLLQMLATGTVGVIIYKALKHHLFRQRPFVTFKGIICGTAPLDVCSFPSGHTLHAVSFSTLLLAEYPALAWLLVPFSLLTALSRIVLGLHYPSDVLIGASIGFTLAQLSFLVFP